ncbi:MAG TPA: CHAT domain-containing protein [Streptosporangiaceae bacterium]|nr:CHAT domain-containing protein [Streptosporangiaceae bacterium]
MSEAGNPGADTSAPDYLLVLAHSRPAEALALARAALAGRPRIAPAVASIAHQAAGISLRDLGQPRAGLSELRRALRSAQASHLSQREADVRASLGLTMALAGSTTRGLAHLDQAARMARGVLAGRVLMRRGDLLAVLGRLDEALSDLNAAVAILRRHRDVLWEARSRTHRGLVMLAMGRTRRADAEFLAAEQQYELAGQEWECATARHNRGLVAAAAGRVPDALQYLADASRRYEKLGTPMPDVAIDRCAVLLSAGLAADAWTETDDAARLLGRAQAGSLKFAELLFFSAKAALAAGQPIAARDRAEYAARLFRRQGRQWWTARNSLVLAQARYAEGDTSKSVYRLACSAASSMIAIHADDSPAAQLLAGRLALARGARDVAEAHLNAAAMHRRSGSTLGRIDAWLGHALLCQLNGRETAMLSSCRRGLEILEDHQLTLGATELRAAVTAHGRELVALGQRAMMRRGRGGQILAWSERWRATVLAAAPVRPPRDPDLGRHLSALREVCRQLDRDEITGPQAVVLRRERARLEAAVRARVLGATGTAEARGRPFILGPLLEALRGSVLIELIELDGVLRAVTVNGSGIRMHDVGSISHAAREVDFARFLLLRLASGRPVPSPGRSLADAAQLLETALLGPAADQIDSDGVIVVPPGRLNAVPWGLLPALRDKSVSVNPSAASWLRAVSAPAPARRKVVVISGPGLQAGDVELTSLAARYPDATVIADGMATAERVLKALDNSWLAHVAAHGRFRADNPLFSSLQLEDGPLNVYDFETLRRSPHRLVLSSCESGRGAPAGADELLGLASSLMPMGTVGVVAAVVPVSDRLVPALMDGLHEQVARGAGFPEALRHARSAASAAADPVKLATACSFLALGV